MKLKKNQISVNIIFNWLISISFCEKGVYNNYAVVENVLYNRMFK